MKNKIGLSFIVVLGFLLFISCQPKEKQVFITVDDLNDSLNTLIIMHPTVNNIKTIKYLTDNEIIPAKSKLKIVGVFHDDEVYDYNESKAYILKHDIDNVFLLSTNHKLNTDIIYHKNSCSAFFESVFKGSKAIIFFGGPDMPPACYNQPTSLLTVITDPNRHLMELSFLFHLLGGSQDKDFKPFLNQNPNFTILGICLGMQSINVATGGTLYQDIPSEIYGFSSVEQVISTETNQQHRNYYTNYSTDKSLVWGSFHQVNFTDQFFKDIVAEGTYPNVLSSHHQCINRIGYNINVAGLSMDGKVIEAIKHNRFKNVVGVQFHPEPPFLYEKHEVIRFIPNQPSNVSYLDLYGGDAGERFHREFWKRFGQMIL